MSFTDPYLFFLVLGASLIAAELLIFNLSMFWFLFIGIGATLTALISWLVPGSSWLFATATFVITSTITSFALYKPLKRWQQTPNAMPGNDAIGQTVEALTAITESKSGSVTWSGTTWAAKLQPGSEPISEGEHAQISEITGIVLLVKKPGD